MSFEGHEQERENPFRGSKQQQHKRDRERIGEGKNNLFESFASAFAFAADGDDGDVDDDVDAEEGKCGECVRRVA